MAKKPILVEIKKTKHQGKQKFTYKIDKPGKGGKITKLERFATASNARRAAAAELKGIYLPDTKTWRVSNGGDDRVIQFINQ